MNEERGEDGAAMKNLIDEHGVFLCENLEARRQYFLVPNDPMTDGRWGSVVEIRDTQSGERRSVEDLPTTDLRSVVDDLARGLAGYVLGLNQ